MRKSLTAAILCSLLALGAGGPAAAAGDTVPSDTGPQATELEQVSAYTQPSIVYLQIEWTGRVWDRFNKMYLNEGNPFFLSFGCTGFVVNPDGWIATAGHCVDPNEVRAAFYEEAARWALDNGYYVATDLTVDDVLGFDDYVVRNEAGKNTPARSVQAAWSVSAGGVETGQTLPARVTKFQGFENGDGALVKVEADDLNALPLSDEDLGIGTEVVAVGYPASVDLVTDATFTPSFKEGSVSSKKTVSGGLLTVYEISAAVAGGMSGGPTVNLDGEVVGFNSFGINSAIETQQFNFVRPVGTVKELLGDAGTSSALGEVGQAYRDGLDAYFAGDKTTAVEKLEFVLDKQPTHEMAKTYLDRAEELPEPAPVASDEGVGMGLVLGIGGALLLLLLLGGVVLFLLTRRKKASRPTATPTYMLSEPSPGVVVPQAPLSPTPLPPGPPPAAQPAQPAGTATPVLTPPPVSTPVVDDDGAAEDEPFCPGCGTAVEPHQKFCKHCGAHL
jgi:serine protease Do